MSFNNVDDKGLIRGFRRSSIGKVLYTRLPISLKALVKRIIVLLSFFAKVCRTLRFSLLKPAIVPLLIVKKLNAFE